MTELEAINTLLSVIGEAPIDKLSDISANEISDSALARKTLAEVNRDVQAEGWTFNTEYEVSLPKDTENQYKLPANSLRCDFSPNRYPHSQYVARGNRVYDRQDRTFDIALKNGGADVVVDQVVFQLPWDELPHQAQQYMTIRAARIYSDRFINSNVIYTYTVQDESYARGQLMRSEESMLSNNLLWGNDRGMSQGLGYVPATGTRYRTH